MYPEEMMKESGCFHLVFCSRNFALYIWPTDNLGVDGYQKQKPFNTKEMRGMEHIAVPYTKDSR